MKFACGVSHSPARRADAGNEAAPVCEQNKDEYRGEKPKRLLDEFRANDVLKKFVKALRISAPNFQKNKDKNSKDIGAISCLKFYSPPEFF